MIGLLMMMLPVAKATPNTRTQQVTQENKTMKTATTTKKTPDYAKRLKSTKHRLAEIKQVMGYVVNSEKPEDEEDLMPLVATLLERYRAILEHRSARYTKIIKASKASK